MKTRSKALLLTLCAVALVVATVFGTMAYLTSTDTVTNTFTVGNVAITLDEAKVDTDGKAVTPAERVKENNYKLMPGHTYTKDPTVHVAANSENSYIFVKLDNGIANFEAATSTTEGGYKKIAEQITANGWAKLEGVDGVYYKEYTSSNAVTDIKVFETFKIADNANTTDGWGQLSGATVTVTAYAVQKDGFDTATAAWDATFGAQPSGT